MPSDLIHRWGMTWRRRVDQYHSAYFFPVSS